MKMTKAQLRVFRAQSKRFNIKVGKKIRAARKSYGWTAAFLADLIGIQEYYVLLAENGKRGIIKKTALRYCEALNLEYDYLLPPGEGPKYPRRKPKPKKPPKKVVWTDRKRKALSKKVTKAIKLWWKTRPDGVRKRRRKRKRLKDSTYLARQRKRVLFPHPWEPPEEGKEEPTS